MEPNVIPEPLLPKEAFAYWPQGTNIVSGHHKLTLRFIFYKVDFTQFELEELEKLKDLMKKRYDSLKLSPFFNDQELIRLLLANKFDLKKTMNSLIESIQWRKTNIVNNYMGFLSKCSHVLEEGSIYIHGIDHKYRPIIIINALLMDFNRRSAEDYTNLLCYTLQYAITHLMLPGQIENWVVITDLGHRPLSKLKLTDLKMIIKVLQTNFKCRMVVDYIVNAPSSLSFIWRLIKHIIDPLTVRKIRILKGSVSEELFTHTARNQIEEKYGGTAPNATVFWPVKLPEPPYHAEGQDPCEYLTEHSSYPEYFPVTVQQDDSFIESIPNEFDDIVCEMSEENEISEWVEILSENEEVESIPNEFDGIVCEMSEENEEYKNSSVELQSVYNRPERHDGDHSLENSVFSTPVNLCAIPETSEPEKKSFFKTLFCCVKP